MNKQADLFKDYCDERDISYEVLELKDNDVAISMGYTLKCGESVEVYAIFAGTQHKTTIFLPDIMVLKNDKNEADVLRGINFLNLEYSLVKFAYDEKSKTLMMFMNNLWENNFQSSLTMEMIPVALEALDNEYEFLISLFQ